jgi:hypothetical protein
MLTWSWIIQITIISIILIFLVHHLINFFKSVLTVPKIKDLVNTPKEKYKNIYETILHNNTSSPINNDYNRDDDDNEYNNNNMKYKLEDLLPPNTNVTGNSMKNELKNFIKKQLDSDSNIHYG